MLDAKTDPAFRQDPEGGFVFGDGWLYFCLDARVYGFVLWGSPTVEGIGRLVELLELELERPLHAALVDVQGLTSITALSRCPSRGGILAVLDCKHVS